MDENAELEKNKQVIAELGFEYGGDKIPEHFEMDPLVIKVNLPDSRKNYDSGNGEGCWAYIADEADINKYNTGTGKFNVIMMNTSFYWMPFFSWGTIIQVEGRGSKSRPVLDIEWAREKIKKVEDKEKEKTGEDQTIWSDRFEEPEMHKLPTQPEQ